MKPENLDPRLILDQAPALLFNGHPNGYIDYVNRRWLEEIGATLEVVQGRGWHLPRDLQSGRAANGAALALRRLSQRHGVTSSHIDRP
jgi:PAS domain-containing protein